MKSILALFVMASLAAYGQKIETQKADRTRITRLATTLNHLSVIEFNEPVKEVAVGSSNFKVEWRENKVFIQPLEPDAATNLFIWTASGRQSCWERSGLAPSLRRLISKRRRETPKRLFGCLRHSRSGKCAAMPAL